MTTKILVPRPYARLRGLFTLLVVSVLVFGLGVEGVSAGDEPPPLLVALLEGVPGQSAVTQQLERSGLIVQAAIPEVGALLITTPDPSRPLPQVPGIKSWEWTTSFHIEGTSAAPADAQWPLTMVVAQTLPPDAGRGVVVGVVDTGIADHPALRGRLLPGYDSVTDLPYTTGQDPTGHGTHVAGIIASAGSDGAPRGVAPGSQILPVRTFPVGASTTNSFYLARGIVWATDHSARVINLSLGSQVRAPEHLIRAIRYARDKDVVVVAAGGNCAPRCGPVWPAADASLGVGAVDRSTSRAFFSSVGDHIGLVAPGVEVVSTVPGGVGTKTGTSMSTPFVSGAAAAVLSAFPRLSAEEVVAVLRKSARDLGRPGVDPEFGSGLLDVKAALRLEGESQSPQPTPTASAGVGQPTPRPSTGTARPDPTTRVPLPDSPPPLDDFRRSILSLIQGIGRWFQ